MLDIEQKEDSQEKLASVNGKPTRFYLFAQEFNSIVQKINEVYLGQNPNRITGLGTETVDGNQHTYQGYSWIINGADLDNIDTPSVIVIPTASVGFRRKDISVFNEFGNIVRVPGIETDGDIATTPDVPENTIYFRTYDVVGDLITSDETPPFVGIEYKSKRESDSYTYDNAGENVILPLPGEGQSHLIVENEDIVSIDGFDKSILILVRNGEYPYEGKDYLFENKSPNPVRLNHLTSAEIPSILPNEENVVVPSGGSVWFKFKGDKMAYIMKSWNDPVDLSTKADLVGGKVPASQLPSYVDDVIEGYFNGTNFYTDSGFTNLITPESSKIYVNIAVTPATQYRWSGSAYVQIGGSSDTYTEFFQGGYSTYVAGNWYVSIQANAPVTIGGNTIAGTGAVPSGTNWNNSGAYAIPSGYILDKAWLYIRRVDNTLNINPQIYIERFEVSGGFESGSSILTNIETLVNESMSFAAVNANASFYVKQITIASHLAKNLSFLRVGLRLGGTQNGGLNPSLLLTFKKA